MFARLLLFCTLVHIACPNLFGSEQRVVVRGKFICPSDPSKAKNVLVKLIDVDPGTSEYFLPNLVVHDYKCQFNYL